MWTLMSRHGDVLSDGELQRYYEDGAEIGIRPPLVGFFYSRSWLSSRGEIRILLSGDF